MAHCQLPTIAKKPAAAKQPAAAKRKAPAQPAATKRSRKDAGPQGAPTLNPLEALAMAGGDHAMAFGAMAGHAHAAMVASNQECHPAAAWATATATASAAPLAA